MVAIFTTKMVIASPLDGEVMVVIKALQYNQIHS